MNRYYYDLHIHSCLSPCGDDDMTPGNICQMAALKGLNIVALCDHNTCKNCESFLKMAKRMGLIGICGVEITTAEEIHMVALFENLEDANKVSDILEEHSLKIPNKIDVFGHQHLIDENDEICGEYEYFLPAALNLSLDEAFEIVTSNNGVAFPAHIDKTSNGIVGILGTMPESPNFNCVEYYDKEKKTSLQEQIPSLKDKFELINSDAHFLWDINEKENYVEIDDEPYSSNLVRQRFFEMLKRKNPEKQ